MHGGRRTTARCIARFAAAVNPSGVAGVAVDRVEIGLRGPP